MMGMIPHLAHPDMTHGASVLQLPSYITSHPAAPSSVRGPRPGACCPSRRPRGPAPGPGGARHAVLNLYLTLTLTVLPCNLTTSRPYNLTILKPYNLQPQSLNLDFRGQELTPRALGPGFPTTDESPPSLSSHAAHQSKVGCAA